MGKLSKLNACQARRTTTRPKALNDNQLEPVVAPQPNSTAPQLWYQHHIARP
jgi:hypothetical protein